LDVLLEQFKTKRCSKISEISKAPFIGLLVLPFITDFGVSLGFSLGFSTIGGGVLRFTASTTG
jgi:hypothetical protein